MSHRPAPKYLYRQLVFHRVHLITKHEPPKNKNYIRINNIDYLFHKIHATEMLVLLTHKSKYRFTNLWTHFESLLQNRPLFLAICPGSLWARDNRWLLSRVQWLAGSAGGRGARPFVPVGDTNRDKIEAFCPG